MTDQPGAAVAVPAPEDVAVVAAGELAELPPLGEFVDEEPGAPSLLPVRAGDAQQLPRAAARHLGDIAAGIVVAARRRRKRRTLTAEMAHVAAARGDLDKALEWTRQDHEHRHQRAERRRKAWETAAHLLHPQTLKGIAVTAAVVVVLLVMTGWMRYALGVYRFAAVTLAMAWDVRYGIPAAVLLWFWHLGRTAGADVAPKWARTAADADVDVAIDEAAVTQALRQLRIPQIADYLKGGMPLAYVTGCRQEGRGTYCEIRLPGGLPALEIAKQQRRERLAASLYRHTKEVWPSTGADNSILKLWVADKGALDEGAGPYPLLADGFTDVFKGLPFGRNLRGDPVKIPVIGRNTLCGGAPEQGKSNGARVVAAGYTLDVDTELRIYVPDSNFDFERFKPRCARYVMGAEDEFIEQILGELEELKDEVQSRGQLLIDREQEEVTYALAHAGIGLHPMFVLVEEAHIVIQHRKYGKDISQLLVDIVKLDRKRAIKLFLSTQAPTKDSMPRDVTRNCTNGIAYAVGDHVANDALLGQGAYRAGHRATELIPGADRGTALCKGFSGERSEMVQAYRVSGRSGDDQVTPIVNRAMAELARQKRPVPGTGRGPLAITYRDLLADVAEVTGDGGKVRLPELAYRLQRLDKSYYRGLDGVKLRERLTDEGVRTTNPKNVPTLDPADLRKALAERGELAVRCPRTVSRSPPQAHRLTCGNGLTKLTNRRSGALTMPA